MDRLSVCWPCFLDQKMVDAAKGHGPNGYCLPCYATWVEPHLRAAAYGTDEGRRGVARRLDEAIVRSGLSRSRVADAVQISPARLSDLTRYDSGVTPPVRLPLHRLVLLCALLKTTPNDILGWGEP